MLSQKVTLTATNGLHARPAGELVKLIKSLDGKVRLATAAKSVDGASMLGVLSLGVKSGAEIEVTVEGGAEEQNLQRVVEFIASIKD